MFYKGQKFKNYIGQMCFIVYMRADIIKLSYILSDPYIEVWSKQDFEEQIKLNKFISIPGISVNRMNISDHLIEYQLNLIGIEKLSDIKDYNKLTITEKQHKLFRSYAIPLLKKVFKFNKSKAENTFDWFLLQYGLNVKNNE